MELIREWIVTIVSVIIFVTFIEILIPNSNHKRYINVVVGFLLMIVILTPLTKLINGQFNFEEEILKTSNQLELSTAQKRINNIQYSNKEAVLSLYKSEISKQIKGHIEDTTEYLVKEVAVEVEDNDDSEEFGLIKKLDIVLEEETSNAKHVNKTVEPVQVNVSIGKKNDNTVAANSILINNKDNLIRDDISNLYKVSKDDINIHILKNN